MSELLSRVRVNRKRFTLIELLESTVISSRHFFAQKSAVATQQRNPLFLKRGVGFGERGKTSFPVKRSFSPLPKSAFTLIELLVVIAIIAILAAILLVFGILSIYYNIKRKVRGCTPLHTATYYIVPALYIAIGVLLLFHKSAAVDIILIICGLLTVIDGGILLFNAIAER